VDRHHTAVPPAQVDSDRGQQALLIAASPCLISALLLHLRAGAHTVRTRKMHRLQLQIQ
jgi:hypothetical protein